MFFAFRAEALGFVLGMVQLVGNLFVAHDKLLRKAFAHHTLVEFEIEALMLDKRSRKVVQVDLSEHADEQMQHADGAGNLLIGKYLVEEQQVRAPHAGTVAVDDTFDAVARGFHIGHGAVAVDIENHAQEAVDEQMVLKEAMATGTVRLDGVGQKVAA